MRGHPRWLLLLGGLLLSAVSVAPGCRTLSAEDVRLIRAARASNLGHSRDRNLSRQARAIALDNYDAWSVLDYSVTGAPITSATRARLGLEERQ